MYSKKMMVWFIFVIVLEVRLFGQKYIFYSKTETSATEECFPLFIYVPNMFWANSEPVNDQGSPLNFFSLSGLKKVKPHSSFIWPNDRITETWEIVDAAAYNYPLRFRAGVFFKSQTDEKKYAEFFSSGYSLDDLRYLKHYYTGYYWTAAKSQTSNCKVFMSICPAHYATLKNPKKKIYSVEETVILEVDTEAAYSDDDFRWEYSLDGIEYKPMWERGKKIEVRFGDFLGAELTKNIYIRLQYCEDFYFKDPASEPRGSSPVILNFVPTLPDFKDSTYLVTAKCSNTPPDSLFIPFARLLSLNEEIERAYLFIESSEGVPVNHFDLRFASTINGLMLYFDQPFLSEDYCLMLEGTVNDVVASGGNATLRIRSPEPLSFEQTIIPASGTSFHQGIPKIEHDGEVLFEVKNYSGDFKLVWDLGGDSILKPQENDSEFVVIRFKDLAPGIYSSVIYFNNNQCDTIFSTQVDLLDDFLEIEIKEKQELPCHGDSSASLLAEISAMTAEKITYEWYKDGTPIDDKTGYFSEKESVFQLSDLPKGSYSLVCKTEKLSSTYTIDILEPSPLRVVSESIKHPSCAEVCDGEIIIHVCGGSGCYFWEWDDVEGDSALLGIPGGTYPYRVIDEHGCSLFGEVNLKSPERLKIKVLDVIEQSYFGSELGIKKPSGEDGLIRVSAEHGTPPYCYQWSTGSSDSVIRNLTSGIFYLTVSDRNACEATLFFELPKRAPLVSSFQQTNLVSCFGMQDAALKANVSGGVPPYRWGWKHTKDTGLLQTSLGFGVYEFEVTDSRGIRSFDRFFIHQPDPLQVMLFADSVSGWGAFDGAIRAVADGGTSPYSYDWLSHYPTASVEGLPAGMYYLCLEDANGCRLQDSVCIHTPDSLTLSAIVRRCSYFGAHQGHLPKELDDGRIDSKVKGGTFPYIYQWFYQISNKAWEELLSETASSIDSLAPGRYLLRVTDRRGYSISDTFEIARQDPLIATLIASHPSCFGAADGTVQVFAEGGIPPYFYRWNLGDTAKSLEGLQSGYYSVFVRDSLGTASSFGIALIQPTPLSVISVITSKISGHGLANGAISAIVQGGVKPYSYCWIGADTIYHDSLVRNLKAGIYQLQVTDSNGCQWMSSIVLNEPNAMEVESRIKPVSYVGSIQGRVASNPADGEIYLEVSGGVPPYQYFWQTGERTPYLTGISEGTYTVLIKDSNDNETSVSFLVESSEPLMLTVHQERLIACSGTASAQLQPHVSGGIPPYSFHWSTGDTTIGIDSIPAGKYELLVSDSMNVRAIFTIQVQEPKPMTIEERIIHPQCPDLLSGSIELSVSGGIPPYQYRWNTFNQTARLSNLSAGTYSVAVKDANQCEHFCDIILETQLTLSLKQHCSLPCFGDSNGALCLSICGGIFPYTIRWDTGDSTTCLSNLKSGRYTASIRDAAGHTASLTAILSEPNPLTLSVVQSNPTCFEGEDGSIEVSVNGGTPPYFYQWSNMERKPQISNISAGSYSLFVTDSKGCSETYSTMLINPPKLEIELGQDQVICAEQFLTIDLRDEELAYVWKKDEIFFHIGQAVDISESGAYTVVAENSDGCKAFDTLHVEILFDRIDAEFWSSYQAIVGEHFIVANISQVWADSVVWTIVPHAEIRSQDKDYLELCFRDTGVYEICLTSYRNGCSESKINTVNVSLTDENLGVSEEEILSLSKLKIFPNPAEEYFNFSVQAQGGIFVKWALIQASTGTAVLSGKVFSASDGKVLQTVALSNQVQGVYILRVFNEEKQLNAALIIR